MRLRYNEFSNEWPISVLRDSALRLLRARLAQSFLIVTAYHEAQCHHIDDVT